MKHKTKIQYSLQKANERRLKNNFCEDHERQKICIVFNAATGSGNNKKHISNKLNKNEMSSLALIDLNTSLSSFSTNILKVLFLF